MSGLGKEIRSTVRAREVRLDAFLTKKALQHAGTNPAGRYREETGRGGPGPRSLAGPPTAMEQAPRQGHREDEEPNQGAVQNLGRHMGCPHASGPPGVH